MQPLSRRCYTCASFHVVDPDGLITRSSEELRVIVDPLNGKHGITMGTIDVVFVIVYHTFSLQLFLVGIVGVGCLQVLDGTFFVPYRENVTLRV